MSLQPASNQPVDPHPRQCVTRRRAAPQRAWVCGYSELGKCCEPGPTADGRCCRAVTRATGPGAHNAGHNASHLTNHDASDAGSEATDEQLPPCIPRRSHWYSRNSVRVNLAVLTGGVLLLVLSLPSREKHFVPGELSSKHAQILENTLVSQRCGLCHPDSHAGSDLQAFVREFKIGDGRQDALCMQCHKGHMPNASARNPHDMTEPMWHSVTQHKRSSALAEPSNDRIPGAVRLVSKPLPEKHVDQTSCAACHIEHHGRRFDLKAMADDRCQACHSRKFESFSSGHPEFANFPAERARALAFSHQLHADKHFPQKSREFDCRRCHIDAAATATVATGQISRSVTFEKACAECHREPIRAATVGGWALIELPSIEASAAAEGSGLEDWPRAARFGFEGSISPVMRALLAADPDAQAALKKLPSTGKLSQISTLDNARQEVTTALAHATEKLIVDTARDGQSAWRQRLETVTRAELGRELTDSDRQLIEAMIAGLPPDLFRKMASDWFQINQSLASNGSHANEGSSVERTAKPSTTPTLLVSTEDDDLLLSGSTTDEGLLDETVAPAPSGASLVDDSLLSDAQSPGADASLDAALDPERKGNTASAPLAPLKGSTHVSAGGWYLDEPTLALRVMPIGHADPTLAAWSLWWHRIGPLRSAQEVPATRTTGESLGSPAVAQQIPGGCVECHQLPAQQSRAALEPWAPTTAWKISRRPLSQKEFTKFNHGPHLTLPAVSDCKYCHVLPSKPSDSSNANSLGHLVSTAAPAMPNPHGSEFEKMQLSQCVACHRPNGASAGCLQCHNYHITSVPERSVGR